MFSPQKVEITAFVSLLDMIQEELAVASSVMRFGRTPGFTPLRQFLLRHLQCQASFVNVEADDIPILDQCQRPPGG